MTQSINSKLDNIIRRLSNIERFLGSNSDTLATPYIPYRQEYNMPNDWPFDSEYPTGPTESLSVKSYKCNICGIVFTNKYSTPWGYDCGNTHCPTKLVVHAAYINSDTI